MIDRKIAYVAFDLSDSRRAYLIKECTLGLLGLIRREGGKATTSIRFERTAPGFLYAIYSLDLPANWFVFQAQEDADDFYIGGRRASRAWETGLHKERILGDTAWKMR